MSSVSRYFFLAGKGRDNYTTENKTRWRIRDTWLCVGCLSPKNGTGAVDIAVEESRPIAEDLGMIAGTGVGGGKRALFEQLGMDDVLAHLHLGRLLMDDGVTPFPQMVTYHGKYSIIVRGETHAGYRRCDACHRLMYSALEYDYLYPQPDPNVAIFDAGQGRLVVSERIASRVDVAKWRGLKLVEPPVLESPRDGLGELAAR